MKINYIDFKSVFKPFTITIETEKEAEIMWAALNVNNDNLKHQASYGNILTSGMDAYSIWKILNDFYDPRKVK
jgi:hypothetical protein